MDSLMEIEKNDDLAFFGQVNASISHELKNILAVISETAGLMNDLMELAAGGKQVAPEKIMSCGHDIVEEIQRGFVTINQMNRFSHSMDQTISRVDLIQLLELMTGLAKFLSFACRLRLGKPPENSSTIRTCPFRLQNLIYRTLVYAFKSTGPDGEVHITIHRETNDSVCIAFSGIGSGSAEPFPEESTKKIAASIGAEVRMTGANRTIEILVPELVEP
jgi:signal transduction histidine kinase